MNSEQVTLLKNYLHMGDASEMEVKAGLEVARRYRLDPFKQGQIWFIKRWDSNAANLTGGKGAYVRVPQVGIYGMLHIAARDFPDFGSLSEPEYGPMFEMVVEGHKFKAPEWCRVKAFKKGIAEPSVATIYFDEFCPEKWDNVKYFWARMPRNQIAKCCKAQVVRQAYPDLGGLYIPEEMERSNDDFSPSGRALIQPDAIPSRTTEANEALEDLKRRGLWCDEHNCTRNTKHLRECESSRKALEAQTVHPPKAQIPNDPIPVEPIKERQWLGTVEIDWTAESDPIVRGDISNLLELLQKHCSMEWREEWWHVKPKDRETILAMCDQLGYRVQEILPKVSPSTKPAVKETARQQTTQPAGTREANAPAAPNVVSCTIERVNSGMAGKNPVKHVTVLLADRAKPCYSCFDKNWFDALEAGAGKFARLITKQNGKYINIVGALNIGSKEWDESGTPVVQVKDREAGGKTLF